MAIGERMTAQHWDVSKSEGKLEQLAEVLKGAGKHPMLILCHNNPDPDSIGCAAGFNFLLKRKFGIRSVLGYGGAITRAENKAMVHRLRIHIRRFQRLQPAAYYGIALMDGQPGTGNTLLSTDVPPLIVIDHHPLRKLSLKSQFCDVRKGYGATSTIVTEYLVAARLTPSRLVAAALLYGIKTDTASLVRGAQEVDFLAFNYLSGIANPRMLGWIEKPKLSEAYFFDYHRGLSRTTIYRDVAVSFLGKIHAESIVPELADQLLRIDGVTWSFCMGAVGDFMVLSMRSSSRKYRAGNVIRQLVGRHGFGGGHRELAGGYVPLNGMGDAEITDLANKFSERLLHLIGKEGCHGRPLVEQEGGNCCPRGHEE
ncbi:MAG: DHH family phosphoesterase [Desulfomonile sp.]|nr:DHH family phosphoesterase [Desulfomonile sp.]